MKECNNSKIDSYRNSVRCGVCKMLWGLERMKGDEFECKRCLTMMVINTDPMPIRDFSLKLKDILDTKE